MTIGLAKFDFSRIETAEMQDIFVAMFAVIARGCADKIAQVNIDAIDLFVTIIQDVYKNFDRLESKQHKIEFGIHINSIIDSLLIKIGDNN